MNIFYNNRPFTISSNSTSFNNYTTDDINFIDVYYKGISCNNGINKIDLTSYTSRYENQNNSGSVSVSNTYECAANTSDGPLDDLKIQSLNGTSLDDIAENGLIIDCGNHPITYMSIADGKVIYSCGPNTTDEEKEIKTIEYTSNDESKNVLDIVNIDCEDKVLTKFEIHKLDKPYVRYICKQKKTNNTTSNAGSIFLNTNKSNFLTGFNVSVNNYAHPTIMWGNPLYSSSVPSAGSITNKTSDRSYKNQFMNVNCEGSGITGISVNSDDTLRYGCSTKLKNLKDYSYTYPSDPGLYKYYSSGAMLNKVKCPSNTVLSSFSTTVTKDGPKVKWACGNF